MSPSLERLEAVLKWAEERMKREEQEERWQTELDGMLFTNHPGNVIKRAKDMSPDVARYEHDKSVAAMLMALDSLNTAREELIKAIDLARKSK